jgi:hypothetical protein
MNAVDPAVSANPHSKRCDPTHRDEDRAIGNDEDEQNGNIAQDHE